MIDWLAVGGGDSGDEDEIMMIMMMICAWRSVSYFSNRYFYSYT